MATDVLRVGRKQRQEAARAAKEKREKIILGVGCVLLVGVLAFEGPKTLSKLNHSTPAPAPAPVTTTPAATAAAPARPVNLASLHKFGVKDPFVPQLGTTKGAANGPTPATPPAVRTSHFVEKDPFVQQLTVKPAAPATSTAQPVSGSGKPVPVAGRGAYIVILASVPIASGHRAAIRTAAAARAHGVPGVHVVVSSKYPTLRSGYYAVYSGPYATLAQAQKALESIRGQGYVSAYTRILGH